MVKFVSIFIAHPQSSSLCISLLETKRSVMTGTASNVIEEKERPKLCWIGSLLICLTLAGCNLLLDIVIRPQFDISHHQMIQFNVIL